jgi:hypothetical protein
MFSNIFNPLFAPQGMPTSKPKFVEGTVHQLARVLYEVHSENESQPTVAIQEALRMFGEDLDRNTILQDAKISAEALVLKRTILLSTKTSQPTMTVFEQAEKIKQSHISKLQTDMDATYSEAQESTANEEGGSSDYEDLMQKYWDINQYREKLKEDILQAEYTEEELSQAERRIEKIKQIESRGKSEIEDPTLQMKEIWKQLVQSLLLLKCKTQGTSPITFKNTPSASKEPIGRIARDECGNLNRLEIAEGELLRSFSLRCRHEQRYCTWLRALHAPPPSTDTSVREQGDTISKQVDEDMDHQLFSALKRALPLSLAYIHSAVEERNQVGSKFSALLIKLETTGEFMRENSATRKVSFLDQQHEHSASVALATWISKDPKGSPTSENITENYQKTVSTNFKMRKPKIEKRHREEEEEEGEEKEDPSLHYINQEEAPPVDPYVEEMWGRIMMLEAQSQPQTRNKLPCFDFQKGKCVKNPCRFSHDPSKKGGRSEKEETTRRGRSRSPPNDRSLSPRRRPYHKNQVLGPTPTQEEEKEGVRGSILIHKEKEEDLGPPPIHKEKEKGEKEKGEIFQQDSSGVLDFEEKEREKDQDKDPNLEFR